MATGISPLGFMDFQDALTVAVARWAEARKGFDPEDFARQPDEPATEEPVAVRLYHETCEKLRLLFESHRLLVFTMTRDNGLGEPVDPVELVNVINWGSNNQRWLVHRENLMAMLDDHFPAKRGRLPGGKDFGEEQVAILAVAKKLDEPRLNLTGYIRELASRIGILPGEEFDEERTQFIDRIKKAVRDHVPPTRKRTPRK